MQTTKKQGAAAEKKPLLTNRQKSHLGDFACVLPALALLAVFTYLPSCKRFQVS